MAAELILKLAIILLAAKHLGELFKKINLPSLLGELVAGIILGPAVIGWIGGEKFLDVLAEIGIILAIFLAGFEQGDISELLQHKNTSLSISAMSSTIPILAVVLITQYQGYTLLTSLFLAVALGATSMGVSLRSLAGVDETQTRVGRTVIGSLVVNDITGLLLLTGVATYADISLGAGGSIGQQILESLGGVALCFAVFYIGIKTIPRLTHNFIDLDVEQAQFSLAVIIILVLAWFASTFGLSSIIGAFIAGLILSRSPVFETKTFHEKVLSVSYGFFVPVFFVMTGTYLEFANFFANALRALLFLAVITPLQIAVGYIASRVSGYSDREGLLVGLGMLPYGEVTLVVMSALINLSQTNDALSQADITGLFSTVLVLILFTVVLAPTLMKLVNHYLPRHEHIRK